MKPTIDPFAVHLIAVTLSDTTTRPPEDSAEHVEMVFIKRNTFFCVLFCENPCRHHLVYVIV
jgi:hypothetical protein